MSGISISTERPATAQATVFVVDDDVGVRDSLRTLTLSMGLAVETYASGEEFLAAYDPARPGCLVMEIRMRGSRGLDLQAEIRRRNAILPIIIQTAHGNVPTSVRALKAGALDFLQKPVAPAALRERIRTAIEIDRQARAAATKHASVATHLASLTPREREVMDLLVTGSRSNEVAAALHISVRTVEVHRRTVFWKMDVSSAAELVGAVLRVRETDLYQSAWYPRPSQPTPPGLQF